MAPQKFFNPLKTPSRWRVVSKGDEKLSCEDIVKIVKGVLRKAAEDIEIDGGFVYFTISWTWSLKNMKKRFGNFSECLQIRSGD
jgi:hypothetical protein